MKPLVLVTYQQHFGGAALTHQLLVASADTAGREWDEKRSAWEATNVDRRKKSRRNRAWRRHTQVKSIDRRMP